MLTVGVVVPNYNGAAFLAEAIESVLQPSNAEVTCLVMDGGSKDGSLEILARYGDRIQVISEKDAGQADAIAKGFARLNTDLVAWLNSDDCFLPGAFDRVVDAALENRDSVLFHGDAETIDGQGRLIGLMKGIDLSYDILRTDRGKIIQPGSFYRREAIARCDGGPRLDFFLMMDAELWIRLARVGRTHRIDARLAQFRIHEAAKSARVPFRYYRETFRIARIHDASLRGFSRRARKVARHFVQWKLGLRLNDRKHLAAPRNPPWVFSALPAPTPTPLKTLAESGEIALRSNDHRADVRISSWPQTSSKLLSQRFAASGAELPLALLIPLSVDLSTIRSEDVAAPSFFICSTSEQMARLSTLGVPTFRMGLADEPSTWSTAIAVALRGLM